MALDFLNFFAFRSTFGMCGLFVFCVCVCVCVFFVSFVVSTFFLGGSLTFGTVWTFCFFKSCRCFGMCCLLLLFFCAWLLHGAAMTSVVYHSSFLHFPVLSLIFLFFF